MGKIDSDYKLRELQDAKARLEAIKEFMNDIQFELDAIELKAVSKPFRTFTGKPGEDDYSDQSKWSPIKYTQGVPPSILKKAISTIFKKYTDQNKTIIDSL